MLACDAGGRALLLGASMWAAAAATAAATPVLRGVEEQRSLQDVDEDLEEDFEIDITLPFWAFLLICIGAGVLVLTLIIVVAFCRDGDKISAFCKKCTCASLCSSCPAFGGLSRCCKGRGKKKTEVVPDWLAEVDAEVQQEKAEGGPGVKPLNDQLPDWLNKTADGVSTSSVVGTFGASAASAGKTAPAPAPAGAGAATPTKKRFSISTPKVPKFGKAKKDKVPDWLAQVNAQVAEDKADGADAGGAGDMSWLNVAGAPAAGEAAAGGAAAPAAAPAAATPPAAAPAPAAAKPKRWAPSIKFSVPKVALGGKKADKVPDWLAAVDAQHAEDMAAGGEEAGAGDMAWLSPGGGASPAPSPVAAPAPAAAPAAAAPGSPKRFSLFSGKAKAASAAPAAAPAPEMDMSWLQVAGGPN